MFLKSKKHRESKQNVANICQVRIMISDYLFTITESDMVKIADWTRQPKELKGEVEVLQRMLVV